MEIAIISGKGGTGKSCISAAFATLDERVVLADCDTDAANLYLIFDPVIKEEFPFAGSTKAFINQQKCHKCGLCQSYCRFNAIDYINNSYTINNLLCDGCNLCTRICPVSAISMEVAENSRLYAGNFRNGYLVWGRLAPGEENTGKLVSLVRSKAKEVARINKLDTIIIDGPPGTGCPVAATVTGTDKIVIVTEPTCSALIDLKRLIESLKSNSQEIVVIINKSDLNNTITTQIDSYCNQNDIQVAGKLPFDPDVVRAMVNCKSMTEWATESEFSKRVKDIFKELTGYDQQKRVYTSLYR